MSIHAHKTGLNKTLGQQSDAIVTTDLTGNFIPTAGIETLYWDNQVSSGLNLRRLNGVTHSTTDPDHFLLDGTDDYLGKASSGYGGTALELGGGTRPFTLGQWFKYNNVNHYIFYCGTGAYVSLDGPPSGGYYSYILLEVLTSNDQCKLTVRDANDMSGDENVTAVTFSSFTFADDTWYYVALTHDGAADYSVYVNGSFIGSLTSTYAMDYGTDTNAIECGAKNIDATLSYSGAGTKIGHIHVYENGYLTASQVRQNFLATHDMHDARIYGGTYTA